MKFFITAILILFFEFSYCQEKSSIGVSFTPELTGQHSPTYWLESMKPTIGYSAAVDGNYFLGKRIGVFGRVGYFHKEIRAGLDKNRVRVLDEDDPIYQQLSSTGFKHKLKESYLEPAAGLLLRTLPSKHSFQLSLGISYSLILHQYDPYYDKENNRQDLKKMGMNTDYWNGLLGIGYNYYLGEHWKIQVEANSRYAFTNMVSGKELKSAPPTGIYNPQSHTYSLGLKVGVSYVLCNFKN